MGIALRWRVRGVAGLGAAAVAAGAGCQTYPAGFGGMTLPTPHYLKHYPQYFPPDPPFPLQRELNSMQDPERLTRPGAAGVGVPAPLPAPGGLNAPSPAGAAGSGGTTPGAPAVPGTPAGGMPAGGPTTGR